VPRITYFDGFGYGAQKRETGSIASGGISEMDPWFQWIRNGDLRNPRVHLNSPVSHFLYNVTFLCKLRRIHVMAHIGIMRVTIPVIGSAFEML